MDYPGIEGPERQLVGNWAMCLPRKIVAFIGVPVEEFTLANQYGTMWARPSTHR